METGVVAHQEAISLKTAVLECWPEVNILVAIHAIKAGEISYGYHNNSCTAVSVDDQGAVVVNDVRQSVNWRVERRHGKRILEMNTTAAADAGAAASAIRNDNGTLHVRMVLLLWKGDCRVVPPLPRFVAMHKPIGIITTMREGKLPAFKEEEEEDDKVVLRSCRSSPESRPCMHCETGAYLPTNTTNPPCSVNIMPHDTKGSCLSESNPNTPKTSTVYDLLHQCCWPEQHAAVHHLRAIGRLDKNTEGLLLFTTRGSWISALSAPTRHCPKRYRCTLSHPATVDDLQMWQSGTLQFRDAKSRTGLATARPALDAQFVHTTVPPSLQTLPVVGAVAPLATITTTGLVVDVTIVEGRYRQVRRCWEVLRGNRVVRLQRMSYGPIELVGDNEMDKVFALTNCGTCGTCSTNALNSDYGTIGATMPIHVPYGECRELSPAHVAALLPWVRAAA
jgi:pseudouridine synthase